MAFLGLRGEGTHSSSFLFVLLDLLGGEGVQSLSFLVLLKISPNKPFIADPNSPIIVTTTPMTVDKAFLTLSKKVSSKSEVPELL